MRFRVRSNISAPAKPRDLENRNLMIELPPELPISAECPECSSGWTGFGKTLDLVGKTKPSKVELGTSATIDGNFFVGGGTFTAAKKTPVPSLEFGSPGAGFFIMKGTKIKLW
jgi:hypothetical protein